MSTIEYTDGKGRTKIRNVEVGFYESSQRKNFLGSFLPCFKQQLTESVGDTFTIKLVGSVAANTATENSDIDLLMESKSNANKLQRCQLVTESLRILQELATPSLPYTIDLWFENGFEKRDKLF